MIRENKTTQFPSLAYPFTNYLCIVFMIGILGIMIMTPDMRIAVMMIPGWLLCLLIAYQIKSARHFNVIIWFWKLTPEPVNPLQNMDDGLEQFLTEYS